MNTVWMNAGASDSVPGLPGVVIRRFSPFKDERGSLHELYRDDEIPKEFNPVMACQSWSLPGVSRGPHQHHQQDDYFIFAGPSDFTVYLWDGRPGSGKHNVGWFIFAGEKNPIRLYVPRGTIHAYRNTGTVPGLVVTVTSALFRGVGRKDPVDEIRHELDSGSPYVIPES